MKREKVYLAIDVGAESGRIIAGLWNGKRIRLEEIYRFSNGPTYIADSMRWDVLRIWNEIQNGLTLAGRKYGKQVVSVGADTWGVDFVLFSRNNEILSQPYHYRDARTKGMMEKAFKEVSRASIFAATGLQFMQLNSLFQLLAFKEQQPDLLANTDHFLFMPDFIHWCLCGAQVAEFTIASTSQCIDPVKRQWATSMLKKFELPPNIFPTMVRPGTKLGRLRPSVAERTGLTNARVVAPPAHDTASAVAGVPTSHTGKANWAYLSSGTWSLMGVETKKPVLTPRALALNMTNEGGVDDTIRLLKNIMGLWLVQQCKRSFDVRGRTFEYSELARLATKATALRSVVNPNADSFLNPPDMPKAIQDYCRKNGTRF